MNTIDPQAKNQFCFNLLVLVSVAFWACQAQAATILVTKQVNNIETSVNAASASAFFTNSPDNLIALTNITVTGTAGLVGGSIGAGDAATTISSGTLSVPGNSTSAGGWVDGNGIPAGITLTFNIQFTTSTPDPGSFLTSQGNSGTQLGNGVGITQTAATTGTFDVGETFVISVIGISGVSFSGSLIETGFGFSSGTVQNPKWNRLLSNNFLEASAGTTVTTGADSWGFGTSTGTQGSNLFIDNNYTSSTNFLTAGPMTFTLQAGTWNLKGVGFQYEVSYEITGVAIVPTWTGTGPDNNWSTAGNWDGGLAPTSGQQVRFGAATRQTNTNNIAGLSLNLISFTNGGFSVYGNSITNAIGVSNLAGINNLNLNMTFTGAGTRIFDIAAGSQLSIGGVVQFFNNGSVDFFGGGTVTIENAGVLKLDINALNANLRVGTDTGQTNTINVNAGGTVTIPAALSGTSANRLRIGGISGAGGIVNINNGGQIIAADNAVNENRALVELGQAAGAAGVLNLNAGGLLHAQRIEGGNVGGDSTFNFNGGLLQAHKISGSTTYFVDLDRVQVQAGGAVIDTTNSISCVMPLTEDSGSPGGGLTKLGSGVLILPAGNTYSGPTVVSNGTLSLVLPVSSSALTQRPNTTLTLAVNGSSWNASSLTFDGNTSTVNLDFGGNGPTVTPLLTGTLTVNGTTVINVSGAFTTAGTYPLIDYTTRTGAGNLQLGTRPAGTIATLVTNVGTTSIDLVVSDIANDLSWTGNVNGDWDIGLTANWDFLTGGSGATTYNENVSAGDYVSFFNGPATAAITLKANVKPTQMVFQNSSTDYSIGGASFGIGGAGKLNLQGGGLVTLTTSNSFSGGVSNNLGFVAVGNNSALGSGPVTLWPTLTGFKSTGLFSDSATARTIANPVQFRSFADNELNFQLGDATRNGKLIFSGPITFSSRRNDISTDSNVEFTGSMGDGSFSKTGPGSLTVKGTVAIAADDQIIAQGDVIVDGATWTNNGVGVRPVAIDGDIARVIVTNNGILTFEAGGNLRVAGGSEGSFTQGNGTNEFIMYSGQLNCVGSAGEASIGNAASLSSFGRITLNGGTATVRALRGLTNAGPTALVLNGATVRALAGVVSLPNFISGFTNAQILAGGVTIDVSTTTVATASQDLQGVGGLTKLGAGVLLLNGNNSYVGPTLVNAGTLGGNGVISGSVTVGAAGTLAAGSSIGTLTINSSLSLAGTTFAEVNKSSLTSDLVNASSANYGGALVISNINATPLVGGETFQLFNVSGAKNGNFSSVSILPATGVSATFNPATGQLTISAGPVFAPPILSGGNVIWTGSGFPPNGTYSILTSTNVGAPIATWTTNATGSFSGSGALSTAIPIGSGSRGFYLLKTP